MSTTQDKPRGGCTGCAFEYQLAAARSGDHKGSLVVRKHNSRTGPGLCSGAGLPPREAAAGTGDAPAPEEVIEPHHLAERRKNPELPETDVHRGRKEDCTESNCVPPAEPKKHCRPGGCRGCCGCSAVCTKNPCGDPEGYRADGTVAQAERTVRAMAEAVGKATGFTAQVEAIASGAVPVVDPVVAAVPEMFADPAPVTVWEAGRMSGAPVAAAFESDCGCCGDRILKGDGISPDGKGGRICASCAMKTVEPVHGINPAPVTFGDAVDAGSVAAATAPSFADPAPVTAEDASNVGVFPVAATYESDCDSCGDRIREGDEIGPDGDGGWICSPCFMGAMEPVHVIYPAPVRAPLFVKPKEPSAGYADQVAEVMRSEFADPALVAAEMHPVSGQPKPDRDRWGRYVLHKQPHTRATSFAKLGSSTYALGEWNERMLIKGLTERPDLLAMAHGLDVRNDKQRLNAIADDAQTHAGNKVAANIGTSLHAFTERLDAGLITLDEVPPLWRARCTQYLDAVAAYGLRTQADWIERTTAVRADQVSAPLPVAGTLDRIWRMPNGDNVIGDLKSGRDLSYGWAEIAVQLAIYAHGVNTFGLFDWRTKTWQVLSRPVRTDFAIVMHLPAEGDGCDLYRVDLVKGWEYAQISGRVQSRQKDKSIAGALTTLDTQGAPSPSVAAEPGPLDGPVIRKAMDLIGAAPDAGALSHLYEYAQTSGKFTAYQLGAVKRWCADRYAELYPGA